MTTPLHLNDIECHRCNKTIWPIHFCECGRVDKRNIKSLCGLPTEITTYGKEGDAYYRHYAQDRQTLLTRGLDTKSILYDGQFPIGVSAVDNDTSILRRRVFTPDCDRCMRIIHLFVDDPCDAIRMCADEI